jgi:hypothetical protein
LKLPEDIEKNILNYLQKKVVFVNENKQYKEGVLLLFSVKDFYLNFTISCDRKERKILEIPFPFDCRFRKNHIEFDYHITNLSKGMHNISSSLKTLPIPRRKKYYNINVVLSALA